eukprot:6195727-Pleurochrysis_carterae.AAC.2
MEIPSSSHSLRRTARPPMRLDAWFPFPLPTTPALSPNDTPPTPPPLLMRRCATTSRSSSRASSQRSVAAPSLL